MSTRITGAYVVSGMLVAAVEGPDARRVHGRGEAVLSEVSPAALGWPLDAMKAPFRLSEDGQRIEWPDAGRAVTVTQLLDDQNASFYFIKWNSAGARPELREDELAGCWQDAAGYTLLAPGGVARIKLVGKGSATDAPGTWRWGWRGPQQFETWHAPDMNVPAVSSPLAAPKMYRVAAFDGKTLIMSVQVTLKIREKMILSEGHAVWWRAKLPKSWEQAAAPVR
jgi:hypothetical protein